MPCRPMGSGGKFDSASGVDAAGDGAVDPAVDVVVG